MVKRAGADRRRAIVIGSGISGLAAAGFLARHVDEVLVLERDEVTTSPAGRAGVPQGRHSHALLVRGRRILEELFPGIVEELVADGALWFDYGGDTVLRVGGALMPRVHAGIGALSCTRGLLESRVRARLVVHLGIRILTGAEVTGLALDASRRQVTGVRVRARGGTGAAVERVEAGTLVVDASGRSSRVCEWLEGLGFGRPRESVVDARVGYASRLYALPPGVADTWKVVGLAVRWPDEPHGAAMLKVEGGRLLVTLVGAGGSYPPTSGDGFLDFARSLPHPIVHDVIRDAIPLTPVAGYRRLENRRRHFEELVGWPDGFVVLGDAVCVFNPVYAQGMTVGLLAAARLDAHLASARGDLRGMAAAFQRDLGRSLRVPWLAATIGDRWWASDGATMSLSDRVTRAYFARLHTAMSRNPALLRRFFGVMHMTRSPATLFAPPALASLAWHGSFRTDGADSLGPSYRPSAAEAHERAPTVR